MRKGWSIDTEKRYSASMKAKWEKRYPVNYAFVKTPSHSLYYFLGYIAGDGNVCINGRDVSVSSCTDPFIIYKFRDLIAPKNKVGVKVGGFKNVDGSEKDPEYTLIIGKEEFWSILNTFDVKNPNIFSRLPAAFEYDFIRGFLDSDGSIVLRRNKTCCDLEVVFYQKNRLFLESLRNLLLVKGLRCSQVCLPKGRVTNYFSLGVIASLTLLEKIYSNKEDFYSKTKFGVYIEVLNSRENCGRRLKKECFEGNWLAANKNLNLVSAK